LGIGALDYFVVWPLLSPRVQRQLLALVHIGPSEEPHMIRAASPPMIYPDKLRDAWIEGKADVTCMVDVQGKPHDCKIVSADQPEFGTEALYVASHAFYVPGTNHGRTVASHYTLNATFRLPHTIIPPHVMQDVSPPPKYPSALNATHARGSADVSCSIDESGHAQDCHVTHADRDEFGQAALLYATHATYYPAHREGKPLTQPYNMHLNFFPPR